MQRNSTAAPECRHYRPWQQGGSVGGSFTLPTGVVDLFKRPMFKHPEVSSSERDVNRFGRTVDASYRNYSWLFRGPTRVQPFTGLIRILLNCGISRVVRPLSGESRSSCYQQANRLSQRARWTYSWIEHKTMALV
jgi:hypothetical protein